MEVEKNIAIPEPGRRRKYPFREMNTGDSFFTKTKNSSYEKNKATACLHTCAKALNIDGFRITTRREKDGVRCWRTQ